MDLALSMYNAHPYFPFKNLGKKCTLYTAKYGVCFRHAIISNFISLPWVLLSPPKGPGWLGMSCNLLA